MIRGVKRRIIAFLAAIGVLVFFLVHQYDHIANKSSTFSDSSLLPLQYQQKTSKGGFVENIYKTVHLDLKGGAPHLSYIRKILPILASAGCNSLLIEYEDMFPYSGKLVNLSAANAYTRTQIKTLLSWAHDLDMEVIPLVQTFGHLEFALKLEEWRHLRELSSFPQEVCPSKDGSLELIEDMLRQVMLLHKGVKYIHIGADEVFHLAACSQCASRSLSSIELYSEYVTKVAEYIHSAFPGVIPIIWDDMIRTMPRILPTTRLPELVEPMIWAYSTDVSQLVSNHAAYWYSKSFKRVWIAGAFKGAKEPTTLLPNIEIRFLNQISWIRFVKNFDLSNIVGFVLTGWSRFDHFAVLCELLPPALPSLLLNLHFISLAYNKEVDEKVLYEKWRNSLICPDDVHFTPISLTNDQQKLLMCNFPGNDVYQVMLNLIELKEKIKNLDESLTKTQGWLTWYNVKHNYTSPWRLIQDYSSYHVYEEIRDVTSFTNYTQIIFNQYFDKFTTKEWIEQNVEPLFKILQNLDRTIDSLIKREVWGRRPF